MLAGVSLALGLRTRRRRSRGGAGAPVLALTALSAFGAVSATWTVASPSAALRWALVVLALAAITVAAAALHGPLAHATILLLVGALAAPVGVVGAVGHVDRIGLDICGSWRPAGPLEYPPALALLCVCALAPAIAGMARSRGALAAGFARLAWLLAATAGVSGSRLEVALAAATLVAVAALLPASAAGAPAVACAVIGLGATFTAVIVGGALGDDGRRASSWPARRGARRRGLGAPEPPARRAALARAVGGARLRDRRRRVAGSSADERVGGCAYAGLTHGRTGIWAAALRTARERPLAGHGLESFLTPAAHSSCASARSRCSTRTTCRSRRGWSWG